MSKFSVPLERITCYCAGTFRHWFCRHYFSVTNHWIVLIFSFVSFLTDFMFFLSWECLICMAYWYQQCLYIALTHNSNCYQWEAHQSIAIFSSRQIPIQSSKARLERRGRFFSIRKSNRKAWKVITQQHW